MPNKNVPDPTATALMQSALRSKKGIKVKCSSKKKAFNLRQNCYTMRSRDRVKSQKAFDFTDHRHGKSIYDDIQITIDGEYLILMRGAAAYEDLVVEDLDTGEERGLYEEDNLD